MSLENNTTVNDSGLVERSWGFYEDLCIDPKGEYKIKRLIVKPNHCLSFQKHIARSEHWVVVKGVAKVIKCVGYPRLNASEVFTLEKFDQLTIPVYTWHQLINPSHRPLEILETQYGKECSEGDIERLYRDDIGEED
jgi:mannose-1-phosphate guanylyltransferase/mannose-6-phosphate isomerase